MTVADDLRAERLYEYVRSLGFHGPDAKPWAERSEDHKDKWRGAVAAIASPPPVAEGMVLVPREPTEAMMEAGRAAVYGVWSGRGILECYRAMLAATPNQADGAGE